MIICFIKNLGKTWINVGKPMISYDISPRQKRKKR